MSFWHLAGRPSEKLQPTPTNRTLIVESIPVTANTNASSAGGRRIKNLAGERTKAALSHLEEKEEKYCRITSYGYDLSKDGNDFVKNKKEQKVISQMMHMRLEGFSYQSICDFLKNKNIKSKSGKDWGKKTVARILKRQAVAHSPRVHR